MLGLILLIVVSINHQYLFHQVLAVWNTHLSYYPTKYTATSFFHVHCTLVMLKVGLDLPMNFYILSCRYRSTFYHLSQFGARNRSFSAWVAKFHMCFFAFQCFFLAIDIEPIFLLSESFPKDVNVRKWWIGPNLMLEWNFRPRMLTNLHLPIFSSATFSKNKIQVLKHEHKTKKKNKKPHNNIIIIHIM